MAYLRLGHIKEAPGANRSVGLKNCIEYICNPLKTDDRRLIGGYNIDIPNNKDEIVVKSYNRMINTKKVFDKENGRQGYHYKLSFAENDNISPDLAMKITEEFCEECFKNFECIYAVHTNTQHIHSHIVFNSVDLINGYKYRYKKGDWAKYIQPVANRLCEKYGLSSLELGLNEDFRLKHKKKCQDYGAWKKKKKNVRYNSFINNGGKYTNSDIKSDIDDCINTSKDWNEFVYNMELRGHKLNDSGKYLKILAPGRKKYCRTYNLSDDKFAYSKSGIISRINNIPFLEKDTIKKKLFDEWDKYLCLIDISKGKRLSIKELQKKEELDFLQKNEILHPDDLLVYSDYLNQADKMLNIYKKKINFSLASKEKYIEMFDYIRTNSVSLRKYFNGQSEYKDTYDKALSYIREMVANGYNPVKLYAYINDSRKVLELINAYKKHIYVEKKIMKRIESNSKKPIIMEINKKSR